MLPMCWLTAWLTMSTQGAQFLFQHLRVNVKFYKTHRAQMLDTLVGVGAWLKSLFLTTPQLLSGNSYRQYFFLPPPNFYQAILIAKIFFYFFLTTPQLLSGNSSRQVFFLPPPNFYQTILIAKFFFYFFYQPPTFIRQFFSAKHPEIAAKFDEKEKEQGLIRPDQVASWKIYRCGI